MSENKLRSLIVNVTVGVCLLTRTEFRGAEIFRRGYFVCFCKGAALYLYCCILAFMFVSSVQADERPNGLCDKLSSIAKNIMRARQGGVEISKVMSAFDTTVDEGLSKEAIDSMGGLVKEFTVRAYSFPRMHDKDLKAEAVVEFGNTMYLECYQVFKK